MGSCLVFCAGGFEGLVEPIRSGDYILAADGGLRHLERLSLAPNAILGDFDSLGYIPECGEVFPVEKDDTDSMLAVRKGLELGFERFLLYGSLDGPRLDHTIANFQTLQFLADRGVEGWLIGNTYLATVIKNGKLQFDADAQGIFSVFCLGTDAQGVTIQGAKYTLENGTLSAGFPLGVSNHFTGEPVQITVENGSLLVLYDRKNGLAHRR